MQVVSFARHNSSRGNDKATLNPLWFVSVEAYFTVNKLAFQNTLNHFKTVDQRRDMQVVETRKLKMYVQILRL